MMTLTKRFLIGLAVLSALLSALGTFSRPASAATGYEQWYGPAADGCFYYWDGYQDTAAACPRADTGFNHYYLSTAGWVYGFAFGGYTNGQAWLTLADGNWLIVNADGSLYNTSLPTTTTSSSGSFIDWSNPNVAIAMEDPLIAGMLIKMEDSYNDTIDYILRPTCYGDVYGDTCYEW